MIYNLELNLELLTSLDMRSIEVPRAPPISRLFGFMRPLWPEIFGNLAVDLIFYSLQHGQQLKT